MLKTKRSISSPQEFESGPARRGVGYMAGVQSRVSHDRVYVQKSNLFVDYIDVVILGFRDSYLECIGFGDQRDPAVHHLLHHLMHAHKVCL